jgi:hypothetical protein
VPGSGATWIGSQRCLKQATDSPSGTEGGLDISRCTSTRKDAQVEETRKNRILFNTKPFAEGAFSAAEYSLPGVCFAVNHVVIQAHKPGLSILHNHSPTNIARNII